MFRIKRTRSVIHSIAHHGVSALSWLHPRLGEESKVQRITEVSYDFCISKIVTQGFNASQETLNAFSTLQSTFERIAATEKVCLAQLNKAVITFGFKQACWPNYCLCCVMAKNGNEVQVKVDGFGRKYGLLGNFNNYS